MVDLDVVISFLEKRGYLKNETVNFNDQNYEVIILKLKKSLFDKDQIFTASYYIIDEKNTVFIDEDNENWLIYFFTDKKKLKSFLNFLINYYYYRENSKESMKIKEELMRIFLSELK